jgi:DNA-binding LacI/PurR family transcriptional regulator
MGQMDQIRSGVQPQSPHVRLADVADASGVSLSTASRALREHPAVRPRTRRRVKAAAQRLGYEPNRMASDLRSRTSSFVGIVVPDITFPFFAGAVKSAQDVLEQAGYQVLVMNTDRHPEQEREALRVLVAHRANGVLLATSGGFEFPRSVPLVFFANFEPNANVARVALSNREGIRLLVEHLIDHGHRRIGYIGGRPDVTSGRERLAAFSDAMLAAGLAEPTMIRISDDAWSPASAAAAASALLRDEQPPTAIVAGGDRLALGVLKAIKSEGLRVPEDVALVSFQDPDPIGGILEPPVTSLSPQERNLGRHAAGVLLQVLADPEAQPSALEVRLPAELVIRRSCGCPVSKGQDAEILVASSASARAASELA